MAKTCKKSILEDDNLQPIYNTLFSFLVVQADRRLMSLLRILLGGVLGVVLFGATLHAQQRGYYQDAVQLAARMSAKESVSELSEHLIYTIEDALRSVAESPYSAAKAVVQQYKIHTATSSSTQHLHLIVDNQATWLNNLQENNPITTYLNQQVIELRIVKIEEQYTLVELYSPQALNMQFLANELSILDDVWLVEIPSEHSRVNDIQLQPTEQGYRLVYSCQTNPNDYQWHYWEFLVSKTGTVVFVGEYGAALSAQHRTNSKRL